MFAMGQSFCPGQERGPATLRRPVLSFPELSRQEPMTRTDNIVSSTTVPRHPLPSPTIFHHLPPSPVVLCSYLSSPGRSCLRSWGSLLLLITAILEIQGRGRTTFCHPVSSGGVGSPHTGPYGGPGWLRTLSSIRQTNLGDP